MSNLIITTKMAFPILSLINKLNLKEPLIKIVNTQVMLQGQKELIYKQLSDKVETDCEITGDNIVELLSKNTDLAEKLENIDNKIRTESLEFCFDVITKIPSAESEFYKTLSIVTGEKIKEIEQKDISEIAEIIMSIVMSKSFMGLLNVMKK